MIIGDEKPKTFREYKRYSWDVKIVDIGDVYYEFTEVCDTIAASIDEANQCKENK